MYVCFEVSFLCNKALLSACLTVNAANMTDNKKPPQQIYNYKKQYENETVTPVTKAFIKYELVLKRFIARFLPFTSDVDEVSQETFLKAYVAERDKAIDQPKPFLFRIAKNIAISRLRQSSRRPTEFIEEAVSIDALANEWSAEDEVMAQQSLEIHCEAVAKLTPQVRQVYLMRKMYGMSHKEIAQHLGISRSTVEKHLIKGVRMCDHYVREKMAIETSLGRQGIAKER